MFLRNILLAVGVIALLAGAALATLWFVQPSAIPAVETKLAPARQSVLVAAQAIPAGTLLRREDMRWQDVSSTDIQSTDLLRNQVSDADYVGAVARRSFAAGEHLAGPSLVKATERGFLAAVLAPGMRAVSIAVDAPQSAAGMILPGDRVDAILTQHLGDASAGGQGTVGETILANLRVVAVDQWMDASARAIKTGTAESAIPKTITVEVSEADAQKLMVATELGKVSFSVRALESGTPSYAETIARPTFASDVSMATGGYSRNLPTTEEESLAQTVPVEVVRGSTVSAH